ncbi:MAG: hypothetical protein EBQ92_09185 [Proteobacteria bacterium]|nr:hypothetical protein [Pseudomonadota bacterium]
MKACSVCKKESSTILMNNRFVCFRCDELLFDIEIESDEAEVTPVRVPNQPRGKAETLITKPTGQK